MFSSNQKLKISGEYAQLKETIDFALRLWSDRYGQNPYQNLTYQTTKDGRFCLGWYENKSWQKFQFEFDAEQLAKIIENFLKKQERKDSKYYYGDGMTEEGFLMEVIDCDYDDKGIEEPFYGIVSFKKFVNYYAK